MLTDTPAKDDHAGFDGRTGEFIQGSNIANYIYDEARRLERMEVDHISNGAIRQGWTEYGNVVLQQIQHARTRRKQFILTLYAQ